MSEPPIHMSDDPVDDWEKAVEVVFKRKLFLRIYPRRMAQNSAEEIWRLVQSAWEAKPPDC